MADAAALVPHRVEDREHRTLGRVAPPHVTLNAIFAGMMPFMVIQVLAVVLLYLFPQIGMWLPSVLYK